MSAEVRGVEQLARKMGATKEAIRIAVKEGIDRTALAMAKDAQEKLKADGHIKTNRLRASIHPEYTEGKRYNYKSDKPDENGETSFDGSLNTKIGKLEAIVGTNVFYAPFIEFGTKFFSGDSFMGFAQLKQSKLLPGRIMQEIKKLIK